MSEAIDAMASAAVLAIVADLTNRRGLRQEWDEIDDEVREEILEKWKQAIVTAARASLIERDGLP